MDFMSDALANGQKLRVLTVLDAYTRECVALEGEAEVVLQSYRAEYNDHRTHSSLGDQTPTEFRLGQMTNDDPDDASKRVA